MTKSKAQERAELEALCAGKPVTICPPRSARFRSQSGWDRLNNPRPEVDASDEARWERQQAQIADLKRATGLA